MSRTVALVRLELSDAQDRYLPEKHLQGQIWDAFKKLRSAGERGLDCGAFLMGTSAMMTSFIADIRRLGASGAHSGTVRMALPLPDEAWSCTLVGRLADGETTVEARLCSVTGGIEL